VDGDQTSTTRGSGSAYTASTGRSRIAALYAVGTTITSGMSTVVTERRTRSSETTSYWSGSSCVSRRCPRSIGMLP
jgi:hypothetical protein